MLEPEAQNPGKKSYLPLTFILDFLSQNNNLDVCLSQKCLLFLTMTLNDIVFKLFKHNYIN